MGKKGAVVGKGRRGSGEGVVEIDKKGGTGQRTPDMKTKKGCKGKSTPVAVKKLKGRIALLIFSLCLLSFSVVLSKILYFTSLFIRL